MIRVNNKGVVYDYGDNRRLRASLFFFSFFLRRILVSIRIPRLFSRPSRISIMDWFKLFFVLVFDLYSFLIDLPFLARLIWLRSPEKGINRPLVGEVIVALMWPSQPYTYESSVLETMWSIDKPRFSLIPFMSSDSSVNGGGNSWS